MPTSISATGDFAETDNCAESSVDYGAACTIHVTFSPTRLGNRSGTITIQGNLSSGNITIDLSGTGVVAPKVNLQPTLVDFGDVENGMISEAQQVTAENAGGVPVSITSVKVTGPFVLASNGCGNRGAGSKHRLPDDGEIRAYRYGSGHWDTDHGGPGRHADGATLGKRDCAAHGYAGSGVA